MKEELDNELLWKNQQKIWVEVAVGEVAEESGGWDKGNGEGGEVSGRASGGEESGVSR